VSQYARARWTDSDVSTEVRFLVARRLPRRKVGKRQNSNQGNAALTLRLVQTVRNGVQAGVIADYLGQQPFKADKLGKEPAPQMGTDL
jgi:hypothetical protein